MNLTDDEFALIDRLDRRMRRALIVNGKVWFDEHLGKGVFEDYCKLHDRLTAERPKHPKPE